MSLGWALLGDAAKVEEAIDPRSKTKVGGPTMRALSYRRARSCTVIASRARGDNGAGGHLGGNNQDTRSISVTQRTRASWSTPLLLGRSLQAPFAIERLCEEDK